QPQVLDLVLYSGDGFACKFTCTTVAGTPVDITGTVKAQIRVDRLNPDDPPVVQCTIGLTDSYIGVIRLSLTGAQTQMLTDHPSAKGGRFSGVWDLEWDPA